MDVSKLKIILIIALAAFAALYLGIAAATAQVEAVAWVAGGIGVSICLAVGRRMWLLMQFMGSLGLTLYFVPGMPDTTQIGQGLFLGFSAMLFLMRRLPMRFTFTELEGWCFLFILCVVQVYLRKPVGLNFMGSDVVGGRQYFDFVLNLSVAFMLSTLIVPPQEIKWYVRLTLIGSLLSFVIGAIGYYSPRAGYWLGSSSGKNLEGEGYEGKVLDEGQADRKGFMGALSQTLSLWIGSKMSPLAAFRRPLSVLLVLVSVAAAAYSGFRNQIAVVGLTYLVALFYRGGITHVLIFAGLGSIGILLLSLINSIAPLPPNMQRTLTLFPGSWEQRYKDDAEGSTTWRTEMWIEALTNKRYIANTWIGDGLGFSAAQLAQSRALSLQTSQRVVRGGFDASRESMMINGGYHSGPVSTIRTIGYVGLCVLLIGLMRLAVHAHRQIMRSRNTDWHYTTLFICIPIMWSPIYFVFIYGTFIGGATALFLGTSMVRILEKNLPLPAYVMPQFAPFVLSKHSSPL